MINPYSDVNLQTSERILGVTHAHLSHSGDSHVRAAYNEYYNTGVRHLAISRYRPSITTYPFDYTNNTFVYIANPFSSTDSLEELIENYSVTINIADDVVGSPNAEHVYPLLYYGNAWREMNYVHFNGLGSTYESYLEPKPNWDSHYGGLQIPYSQAIDNILQNLQFSDSGGVILNHPVWTNESHIDFEQKKPSIRPTYDTLRFFKDCLDYDSRVLGTDIIESGSQIRLPNNIIFVDEILSTGRKCWLFGQGDWNHTYGKNEVLIPAGLSRQEKEHAILKAYRDGHFFARFANTNLSITDVSFTNNIFSITVVNADFIEVYIDGEVTTINSTTATVNVPSDAKYVRAMAYINRDDDPNWEYRDADIYKDIVCTNPIMVNPVAHEYNPAYYKQDPSPTPIIDSESRFKTWFWG